MNIFFKSKLILFPVILLVFAACNKQANLPDGAQTIVSQTGITESTQSSVDLFIQESDLEKAGPIIEDFRKNNPQ